MRLLLPVKRLLFSALFLSALYPAGEPLPAGLIAWWSFDEGSGHTVVDKTGRGADGQIRGNAVWTNGRHGKALLFDGASVVDCGNPEALKTGNAFTVEAWICPEEWIPGTFHGVVAKMPNKAPYAGWALYHAGYNDLFQVAANIGSVDNRLGTAPPREGRWHHVAFTFDGQKLRLFTDGRAVGFKATKGALVVNQEPLLIGQMYQKAVNTGFRGAIDEVRLYDRALSEAELASNAGVPLAPAAAKPKFRATAYPSSLLAGNLPPPSGAPIEECARSVTWGKWNWTPSPAIAASFAPESAEAIAKNYAALGVNLVWIDEYRYILVDEPQWKTYLIDLKKAVDACHRHGMKVALHLTVTGVLSNHGRAHPEQAAFDMETKGGAYYERYGTWNMCPNNPGFRKAYLERIEALMGLGLDGLMPDESSWLPGKASLCGCEHCRRLFKERTGFEVPDPTDKKLWENWDEPRWRAWMAFRIRSQGDILEAIKNVALRFGDKVLTACQCNYLLSPRYVGNDLEDMRRGVTASFFECEPGNPWSWRYNQAEARGYTAYGPSFFLEYSGSLSQQYFSWAFALTCGLRSWTWPELMKLPTFPFRWERKWETIFVKPEPFADTALLYAAPAANAVASTVVHGFIREYIGWAEALTEAHVPYATLAASRLNAKTLAKFRQVILPSVSCLSTGEAGLLARFAKEGGLLIITGESGLYDETGARRGNLALAEIQGVDWVETLPLARPSFDDPWNGGKKIRYSGRAVRLTARSGADVLSAGEDGAPQIISHPVGRGRALTFAVSPGTKYYMPKISAEGDTWAHRLGVGGSWNDNRIPAFKSLMLAAVEPAKRILTAEAPIEVLIQPYRHEWKDYRGVVVHLLNALGTRFDGLLTVPSQVAYEFLDYPDPGKITLTLAAPDVKRAYFVSPDFEPVVLLPVTTQAGRCRVELPTFGRYGFIYLAQSEKDAVRDGLVGTPLVDRVPSAVPFTLASLDQETKAATGKAKVTLNVKEGAMLKGGVDFTAEVSGLSPDWVDFYIDGEKVHREGGAPYWCFGDNKQWDTTKVANGRHTLKVIAASEALGVSAEATVMVEVKN
jgi:hypothetical protein